MKKLTIAVATSLLLTQLPLVVSAQEVTTGVTTGVTRDELVNYLLYAADDSRYEADLRDRRNQSSR